MENEKLSLLSSLEFWPRLTEEERALAISSARFEEYKKGQLVHNCTGSCVGLVLVTSGLLRTYLISQEGREITLFRQSQGQVCILAASCVIRQITFCSLISAETDTRVLIVSAHAFKQLAESNIHVQCYMYKLATERFSDAIFAMEQMLFMGFDRRLAIFLQEVSTSTGSSRIDMTHEQIAKNTGSAREVVTRMLKRFAEEGILELRRGTVVIKDGKKLKKLAQE